MSRVRDAPRLRRRLAALAGLATVLAACGTSAPTTVPPLSGTAPGAPKHIVVVVMENHSTSSIIGSPSAPYINSLAAQGTSLTHMYGVTHPSQPNYIALFSGRTRGITDDSCPNSITSPNLASRLERTGRTFVGYSEGLPGLGSTACYAGAYARKHAPWVNFTGLPDSVNQPLTALPSSLDAYPTVSFVIPDLNHDMHDGSVNTGDTWLRTHLDRYQKWAMTHQSMLVVTFDEDDRSDNNRIATVIVGDGVPHRTIGTRFNHYSMLRTIFDLYGLRQLGATATATPIPLR